MVAKEFFKLSLNKAVGNDGIPAEIIRIGGDVLLDMYYDIICIIWHFAFVPTQWRGGRICELLKKGSTSVCDNFRGLLISDHFSKLFTAILDKYVDPFYNAAMPQTQCGAVAGRGTDFATHFLRSFIDICNLRTMSYAILYVDLSKAFDHAIREVVLGWSQDKSIDKVQSLLKAGLSQERAEELITQIDTFGPPPPSTWSASSYCRTAHVPAHGVVVFVRQS